MFEQPTSSHSSYMFMLCASFTVQNSHKYFCSVNFSHLLHLFSPLLWSCKYLQDSPLNPMLLSKYPQSFGCPFLHLGFVHTLCSINSLRQQQSPPLSSSFSSPLFSPSFSSKKFVFLSRCAYSGTSFPSRILGILLPDVLTFLPSVRCRSCTRGHLG